MPNDTQGPVSAELLLRLAADAARVVATRHAMAFTETIRTERIGFLGKTTVREEVRRVDGDKKVLVKCIENGQDITVERKKRLPAGGVIPENKDKVASPFAEGSQPKHRFLSLGPDKERPTLLRIRFDAAGAVGKDVLRGEALVDERAGGLVWFALEPTETPPLVSKVIVTQSLETITPYGRVPSSGGSDLLVSFLMLAKLRIRSETTYSDYAVPGAKATLRQ